MGLGIQTKLTDKFIVSPVWSQTSTNAEYLHNLITQTFASALLPWNILENSSIQQLFHSLCPEFQLHSLTWYTNTGLNKIYENTLAVYLILNGATAAKIPIAPAHLKDR
jgi:hypothetical protein